MSFFLQATPLTPAQTFASQVSTAGGIMFGNASQNLPYIFALIWSNNDQVNLSPDKTWAALGTGAVKVRTVLNSLVTFFNQVSNNQFSSLIEPAGWTLTQNKDGSITAVASA